jgi:hypothetical protein
MEWIPALIEPMWNARLSPGNENIMQQGEDMKRKVNGAIVDVPKRENVLCQRYTDAEKAVIEAAASKRGMSANEYIYSVVMAEARKGEGK